MLRILEIAWLTIAIVTAVIALYLLITKQYSETVFIGSCSAIAVGFYLVRRRQRIRFDMFHEKEEDESHYH